MMKNPRWSCKYLLLTLEFNGEGFFLNYWHFLDTQWLQKKISSTYRKKSLMTGQENLDQGSEQMLIRDIIQNTFCFLVSLQVTSCMSKYLIIIALKYYQFSKIIFL